MGQQTHQDAPKYICNKNSAKSLYCSAQNPTRGLTAAIHGSEVPPNMSAPSKTNVYAYELRNYSLALRSVGLPSCPSPSSALRTNPSHHRAVCSEDFRAVGTAPRTTRSPPRLSFDVRRRTIDRKLQSHAAPPPHPIVCRRCLIPMLMMLSMDMFPLWRGQCSVTIQHKNRQNKRHLTLYGI